MVCLGGVCSSYRLMLCKTYVQLSFFELALQSSTGWYLQEHEFPRNFHFFFVSALKEARRMKNTRSTCEKFESKADFDVMNIYWLFCVGVGMMNNGLQSKVQLGLLHWNVSPLTMHFRKLHRNIFCRYYLGLRILFRIVFTRDGLNNRLHIFLQTAFVAWIFAYLHITTNCDCNLNGWIKENSIKVSGYLQTIGWFERNIATDQCPPNSVDNIISNLHSAYWRNE